ncbi:Uncharacterized protein Adt_41084 [Abeliophyllum distichum]|uniref:RNase H type-1 domain-containing protein n=1 Tax=Abeliophyllum distichum TaxID=126358 RepID=A0ABD1PPD6_9LAMI
MESLLKARILIHAVRKRLSFPVAVTWRKPKEGCSKVNTYGTLKECGMVAGGGVIRNYLGNVTWVFYDFYVTCSIHEAELKAVATGLQLCWQKDLRKVLVEIDSKAAMLLYAFNRIKALGKFDTFWNPSTKVLTK